MCCRRDTGNQVVSTHPVDVSQPLSLVTQHLFKGVYKWSNHGARDGGYTCVGSPFTKADSATATA